MKHCNLAFTKCYPLFFTIFFPPHHFTQSAGEVKDNFFSSINFYSYFSKYSYPSIYNLKIMGKMKHKIDKLDKNQRFAEPVITIELEAPEEIYT